MKDNYIEVVMFLIVLLVVASMVVPFIENRVYSPGINAIPTSSMNSYVEEAYDSSLIIEDVSIGNVTGKYVTVTAHLSDKSECKVNFLNKGFEPGKNIKNILMVLNEKCLMEKMNKKTFYNRKGI